MKIYAIFVTLVSVILILAVVKWKIATIAITYFCKENFREPTDEEIADYAKKAVKRFFSGN